MEYEELLKRLRETRKKKGISLRKMGEALGVSGQQISFFERGHTALKVKDYLLICDVLKISPRELLDGNVPQGEYQSVAEKLHTLSERDFRIIKDLILLMEMNSEDL